MELKRRIAAEISRISESLGFDSFFIYLYPDPAAKDVHQEKFLTLFSTNSNLSSSISSVKGAPEFNLPGAPSFSRHPGSNIPPQLNLEDKIIQNILKSETPFSGESDKFGKEFLKFTFHYLIVSVLNPEGSFPSAPINSQSYLNPLGLAVGCQNIKPDRIQIKKFPSELQTLSMFFALQKAENEIKNLQAENSTLEKKLKTASRRLLESDKLASLGRFAGGLAHELNTPLGAIQTYTEYLQISLKDAPQKEAGEGILKSVHHCKEIIDNVLSLSKPQKRILAPVSLKEVVEDALLLTHFELKKKKITLKTNFQEHLPPVEGDHTKLVQVVSNLLSNSISAIQQHRLIPKKGIIEISLTAENPPAASDWHKRQASFKNANPTPKNTYQEVKITDNGSGIPSSILGKVFDPFFTTKEIGKGTGLGLSICQTVIEEHHGTLEILSEEENGTTVLMKIPEYAAPSEPASRRPAELLDAQSVSCQPPVAKGDERANPLVNSDSPHSLRQKGGI
jgi:signal transduction histidine kinase